MADDGENDSNKRGSRYRNKQKQIDNGTNKFLRDFDPQSSEREKRKLHRRLYPGSRKHMVYDESGIYIKTGSNICDCLRSDCPGCHFPCAKCSSRKCAHECRQLRRWAYESIENEGSDRIQKNMNL